MGLQIEGNFRDRYCNPANCPLQRTIAEGEEKQVLEAGISIDELKELSEASGLHSSNDFYGRNIPEQFRSSIDDVVYTADCTNGAIEGTGFTNCGSLMARFDSGELSGTQRFGQNVIAIEWMLQNKI